jgi:hypothetical protein
MPLWKSPILEISTLRHFGVMRSLGGIFTYVGFGHLVGSFPVALPSNFVSGKHWLRALAATP